MDDEGFTRNNVEKLKEIGKLQNNWRQRRVIVYQHPTHEDKVVTIGYPFNSGELVVCVEEKDNYDRAISVYPRIAVFN